MNLPNRLSFLRILAVPVFLALLFAEDLLFLGEENHLLNAVARTVALLLTIVVTVTDWLDGKIAREQQLITRLGKLLDPLADKIFVTAALVAYVALELVPAWAVILVIAREFLISGLRTLAADAGRLISADRLGKHKTGWQLGLIITALVVLCVRDYLLYYELWDQALAQYHGILLFHGAIWIPLTVTLFLTVLSGFNYLWENWDIYADDM